MSKKLILVRLLSLGLLASSPLVARADEGRDDSPREVEHVRHHRRAIHRVVEMRRRDGDDRREEHHEDRDEHHDDHR